MEDNFVYQFSKVLEEQGGDVFFTSGDVEADEKMIKATIDAQGYWAGTRYRYFFDKDYNFVRLEERTFGS